MSRHLPLSLRMIPMILVMGIIFLLSHQAGDDLCLPVLPGVDKLAHLLAYAVLAAVTLFAYSERWKSENTGLAVLITIIVCLAYGITDEIHQAFVPGREPSLLDIVADGAGAALAGLLWLRLRRKTA